MQTKSAQILPRSRSDYSAKLKKLEEEKQQLILQRKEEIFSIIDKVGCLSIDNELLAGSLVLLKEISAVLSQGLELPQQLKPFENLVREKSPIFFRRKSRTTRVKAGSTSA